LAEADVVAGLFLAARVFAEALLAFVAVLGVARFAVGRADALLAVFLVALADTRLAADLLAPGRFAAAVRVAALRAVALRVVVAREADFVAVRLGVVFAVTLRALEVAAADTRLPALPAESARGALDGRAARPVSPSAAITVVTPPSTKLSPQANRVGRSVCRQRRFEVLTCVRKAANYMGRSGRFPIAAPRRPVRRYHRHCDDEDE
jgi:hypothetical protein